MKNQLLKCSSEMIYYSNIIMCLFQNKNSLNKVEISCSAYMQPGGSISEVAWVLLSHQGTQACPCYSIISSLSQGACCPGWLLKL